MFTLVSESSIVCLTGENLSFKSSSMGPEQIEASEEASPPDL
jgi:hypothetical protein